MTRVLGVDGGGSKTVARLFEAEPSGELRLVGAGQASGSNPYSVEWDAAQDALAEAVAGACAGGPGPVTGAVLAVAGCASQPARERLAAWAESQSLAESVWVVPDTAPLLADAPRGGPAVGLIAGTGSSALARRADGSDEVVGGWGYLVDDAGSGYALGRDALRLVAQAADAGRAPDALTEAILAATGVRQPALLKSALYGSDDPRRWTAQLAPTVLALAADGDPDAAAIVRENAGGLARLAAHAASRLTDDSTRPPIWLAGGLVLGSADYRRAVVESLVALGWEAGAIADAPDAATVCARIAADRLAGGAVG